MEIEIIPAIQVRTFEELQKKLDGVKDLVNRVQIDIVGEKFADNKSIVVEEVDRANTSLVLDIQLMVNNPIGYLNRCDVVGIERVYGQVEQMPDQDEFVSQAGDLGMQVGLALDIHTPIEAIAKTLPYLDGVLLMSVEVGFFGQTFEEGVLDKIEDLRVRKFEGDICIDGGLNSETIRLCRDRGANHFAVGSYLWSAKNLAKRLEALKRIE